MPKAKSASSSFPVPPLLRPNQPQMTRSSTTTRSPSSDWRRTGGQLEKAVAPRSEVFLQSPVSPVPLGTENWSGENPTHQNRPRPLAATRPPTLTSDNQMTPKPNLALE